MPSVAFRIAKITTLLLSFRALPLGTVALVGVFQALEAEISHAHWAVWRAYAAADAVVVWRAHWVVLVVPFVDLARLGGILGATWPSFYRLLLVTVLCTLMHALPGVSSTADEPTKRTLILFLFLERIISR